MDRDDAPVAESVVTPKGVGFGARHVAHGELGRRMAQTRRRGNDRLEREARGSATDGAVSSTSPIWSGRSSNIRFGGFGPAGEVRKKRPAAWRSRSRAALRRRLLWIAKRKRQVSFARQLAVNQRSSTRLAD